MTRARRARFGQCVLVAWSLIVFLVLPLLVVVPVSLTDRRYLSLPEHGCRSRITATLSGRSGAGARPSCAERSSSPALDRVSATARHGSAPSAAGACRRPRLGWVRALILLPLVVPTIIQALGLLPHLDRPASGRHLPGRHPRPCHHSLPYVFISVSAALAHVDPRSRGGAQPRRSAPPDPPLGHRADGAARRAVGRTVRLRRLVRRGRHRAVHHHARHRDAAEEDVGWARNDLNPTIACVAVALGVVTLTILALEWLLTRQAATPAKNAAATLANGGT